MLLKMTPRKLTSLEVCAGAGGAAVGLEQAGFRHVGLVDNDRHACATLKHNRPRWRVELADLREVAAAAFDSFDLLSGGVPCPPFSKAGKQLGKDDERDLFPEMIRLAAEARPKAVMIENVRGLLDPVFDDYRETITHEFASLGYRTDWKMLNASDFAVPQLRPRVVMIALRPEYFSEFSWPTGSHNRPSTVGETLLPEMASRGWKGAAEWATRANMIAPTLVGGSKKHGGPDLGPTRARQAWLKLGVEGRTIAEAPPGPDHDGLPRLTVKMASLIQGFPPDWEIIGKKTNAYRQVGNAFPPPVARAVGRAIKKAISTGASERASSAA